LIEQAWDLGINYYDTAKSYLNGEDAVAHLSPAVRDRLVVATKTGARGGPYCLRDLERSLKTMNRGWIDVWMTHMVQTEEEYEMCTELGGFCDVAVSARQAGLVRATGASFHAPTGVILRAIREGAFDVVMFQFNLIGRETVFGSSIASYREQLLPAAREAGIGVVVMKVVAGGELRYGARGLGFVADGAAGRSVVGGAVRYAAMRADIATAVVGMGTTRQLTDNAHAVADVDDGQDHLCAEWERALAALGQGECTRCGKCLGVCPEGIEIPKVFRLHDQARFLGMERMSGEKYRAMVTDASACLRCRECQRVCPEEFDIGATLSAAHEELSAGHARLSGEVGRQGRTPREGPVPGREAAGNR
jgi:predicted aldo/keto reductase-like oxidoreductase